MEAYCKNCNRVTWHKRYIGIGTLIACLTTAGLWLIAICFYRERCINCGRQIEYERNPRPSRGGEHQL